MNTILKAVLRISLVSVAAVMHLVLIAVGCIKIQEFLSEMYPSILRFRWIVPIATLVSFTWPLYAFLALPKSASAVLQLLQENERKRKLENEPVSGVK